MFRSTEMRRAGQFFMALEALQRGFTQAVGHASTRQRSFSGPAIYSWIWRSRLLRTPRITNTQIASLAKPGSAIASWHSSFPSTRKREHGVSA